MIDSEKRFYNPLEKYKIDYKKKLEKNRHCKFVFDIVQRIVDLQHILRNNTLYVNTMFGVLPFEFTTKEQYNASQARSCDDRRNPSVTHPAPEDSPADPLPGHSG